MIMEIKELEVIQEIRDRINTHIVVRLNGTYFVIPQLKVREFNDFEYNSYLPYKGKKWSDWNFYNKEIQCDYQIEITNNESGVYRWYMKRLGKKNTWQTKLVELMCQLREE